jgi:hypothetical protein
MFIGIAITPLAKAIAGAYTPPAGPKTFSVTLSGITGATPTSLSAVVSILNGTPSSSIIPSITTNRVSVSNTGVAPFAVQFDATGTICVGVTNPFHDLHYSWHFGDDDVVTWDYGTQPGASKKNRASGGIAAHVFETPGTKTVTCTITNPITGDTVTRTVTVVVQDPDVVFAGANTIAIANGTLPVAGVGGVPAGATCLNITTHAGIIAQMNLGSKRVLLKRGDVWPQTSSVQLSANGPGILGPYGVGAKPTFTCSAASSTFTSSTPNGATDWRIMDIAFNATPMPSGAGRNYARFWSFGEGTSATAGKFGLLLRCDHTDAAAFAVVNDDTVIADCNVLKVEGGGGNCGVYCGKAERLAILGSNFPDASLAEHNIRLQGTQRAIVADTTALNPAWTKHALTIRGYNTAGVWDGVYTEFVIVHGCRFYSNTDQTVTISTTNSLTDERMRNIIIERNYIENNVLYGGNFIAQAATECTFRNNLCRMASRGTAVVLNKGGSAGAPVTNIWVYNNTFYASVAGTQATFGVSALQPEVTNVDVKNNIMYAPLHTSIKKVVNFTGGASFTASNNTPDADIASVSPQFLATPPTTYAEWRTGAASYASGGGTSVPVYDDFFGTRRGTTNSMGGVTSYGSSMVASTVDVSVNRADGSVDVEYRLTNAAQTAVTGVINTADITAIAGVDYTAQTGASFSIPEGSASGTITIPILPG